MENMERESVFMKIAGVIAEYNPFHNGHKYHLEQTRLLTGADYIIAVISGDYTQRGTPAVCDKFVRAKMALENGADLVLELPLFYAAGSAEYFATGATALLDKLGVTDTLCFGSECGNVELLSEIAHFLSEEPPVFSSVLQDSLRKGIAYPRARSLALASCFNINPIIPNEFAGISDSSIYEKAVLHPNNILGIEYIRALQKRKSSIQPFTVQREGAAYHERQLPDDSRKKSSASAIRQSLETDREPSLIKNHVPDTVYRFLASSAFHPVDSNDFSLLLKYRLLMEQKKGYTEYVDVNAELSDKIKNSLNYFTGFENYCGILKSKELTYSRISRALLHILLDMKECAISSFIEADFILYARVLGFRRDSTELLHSIKKNTSIPLITKLADAGGLLNETGKFMLEKDILASQLYDSVVTDRFGIPFISEYSRQLCIL